MFRVGGGPTKPFAQARPADIFRTAFDAARHRAGLDWLHLHDLRHTAASWLLMRGVDIRTLAAILGHRTLQMVFRYTHLDNAHLIGAIERIGDLGVAAAPADDSTTALTAEIDWARETAFSPSVTAS